MPWFVINTHPKKEFQAQANIARQGFNTFMPTFIHSYPRIGERIRPLFTSYLFVEFNPDQDRWYPLCHTLGVKKLFAINPSPTKDDKYPYLKPIAIDTDMITSLKSQTITITDANSKMQNSLIAPGAKVKVISGHFENQTGICSWSSAKRVSLLLDVMHGKLEISFSRDSVELVEAE